MLRSGSLYVKNSIPYYVFSLLCIFPIMYFEFDHKMNWNLIGHANGQVLKGHQAKQKLTFQRRWGPLYSQCVLHKTFSINRNRRR